MEGQY